MISAETPATLILIVLNVLVSGYALYFDQSLVDRFSFRPLRILKDREYHRLITAGFVHVGLWHLAFNMITLYFFGPFMELILGTFAFVVLYFGSELAAHALSLALHRNNASYAAIGASGAISGVLFGFCLFQPFQTIYVFFFPLPAIVFAVGYVVLSIYSMRQRTDTGLTGGIAHEAHLGGALGGLLLTILLEPRVIPHFVDQIRGLV
jgi:membrane associated rhomboid family serine protease